MKTPLKSLRPLVLALALAGIFAQRSTAEVWAPGPAAAAARALDMGELSAQPDPEPVSVTIALALPNLAEAEELLQELNSPGSAQFHQFLSADQFIARFAPTSAAVASVIEDLAHYGLNSERIGATMLKVSGSTRGHRRCLTQSLHRYTVPAHDNVAGFSFHAPRAAGRLPPELAGKVAGVAGLDSRPRMRPHFQAAPEQFARPEQAKVLGPAGNPMGSLTVADFAGQYDVRPLYNQGVLGTGRTIGILTLASFAPADAFAYWSAVGLAVNQESTYGHQCRWRRRYARALLPVARKKNHARCRTVGGYRPTGQHHGLPGAEHESGIREDLVANAVEDNLLADSLSISWGRVGNGSTTMANSRGAVADPDTGSTVGSPRRFTSCSCGPRSRDSRSTPRPGTMALTK